MMKSITNCRTRSSVTVLQIRLMKEATLSILETVQKEGNRQVKWKMEFYNLDAIISVGYCVNSYQATQFRIWATGTLKGFIIKGFVLDDERLKQGNQIYGKMSACEFGG